MTTAREITAALRLLFPSPVRLSVRADIGPGLQPGERFYVRLPSSPASHIGGERGLEKFLGRRLATGIGPAPVKVTGRRTVKRRDCGRDVEFAVRVGKEER